MSLVLLIPAVYLVAVLETSLAPWIEVRHVVPDLFALLAVVWLLRPGRQRGLLVAAAVGLACDLTSAGPLGDRHGGVRFGRLCHQPISIAAGSEFFVRCSWRRLVGRDGDRAGGRSGLASDVRDNTFLADIGRARCNGRRLHRGSRVAAVDAVQPRSAAHATVCCWRSSALSTLGFGNVRRWLCQ